MDYNVEKSDIPNDCINYDTVTQNCRSGCPTNNIMPDTRCLFINKQNNCKCYRKFGL